AHRAGGSRASRAADQGRLRGQEPADVCETERAGQAAGDRSRRRGADQRGGDGIMNPHAPAGAVPRVEWPVPAAADRLRSRHLLGIAELETDEILLILETAEAMKEIASRPIKKVPTLRGRTVVNLFFEPSTRTRTSFEVAEKRLSADTLSIAVATSSVTKGETLLDTVRNLEAMAPDMIVMRPASSGAPHLLARLCRS